MTGIVAIDANLFLRHTVRGFLCAMQDTRGGQVPVNPKFPGISGSESRITD